MKKYVITESQLKRLISRRKLSENLDMEDDGMQISVKMALFSHLSDIQHMVADQKVIDRINFLKLLIKNYPDTRQDVTTRQLDAIYDQMLGMTDKDKKNPPVDKNPFPDGFDISMNEDDSQAMSMVQQAVEEFNQKAEEDLTPDELQEVICTDPDSVDIPSNITNEQKQKLEEFKQKVKATTSIPELKQVKRQLKELRKQTKQQQNEQAGMVTLLGVTMPQGFALVIGGIMLIMVLNILFKLFNIHLVKTVTYWCTGRKTTGFGFSRN